MNTELRLDFCNSDPDKLEKESSMAIGLWPYDETLIRHKEHDVRDQSRG